MKGFKADEKGILVTQSSKSHEDELHELLSNSLGIQKSSSLFKIKWLVMGSALIVFIGSLL